MTERSPDTSGTFNRFPIAIAIILILAAILRLYGQDWDDGHYFHPDERFIATVMSERIEIPDRTNLYKIFDPANSPLNTRSNDAEGEPRQFAYGSLPFLVVLTIGTSVDSVLGTELTSYTNVGRLGRFLTAMVDLGTVILVILFASRVFGALAAVIAGALTASSVILIQLAHFFTVDTWVTFVTIAVLYACLPVVQRFDLRWSLIAAGLGGAALATKLSVGVLGIPIIVATLLGARRLTRDRLQVTLLALRHLAISAVPAVGVFALFEPYAIWRPGPFIDDIRAQWEIVNGHFDIPFTRQFVGTTPGINEIENLVLWGIAPGFGVAALVATLVGLYWAIRDRDPHYLLLMSWIIPYFYVIASSEARFLRYAAPLVPPLAIIVGHQLAHWWYLTERQPVRRLLPAATILVVLAVTLTWSLAFMNVYAGTHPRVDASEWIYENVEPGSTLTREVWDDTLPIRLGPGQTGQIYEHLSLDLYGDRPHQEAFEYIANALNEADYIILASQRLSHSIPRLPWRYPVQSAYYRLLEQERLGYELAYEATNYPGFGSVHVNTLRADESFSVYDHPPVRIYRKVEELSRDELELRFAHALHQPWFPERYSPQPTLLLDEPVQDRPAAGDVGWSMSVTGYAAVAILVWLATLAVLGAIALPVCVRLFGRFADHGAGFASLIGLLVVGILVWFAWSLDLAPFTAWTIIGALVASAAVLWFGSGFDRLRFDAGRFRWSLVATSSGVFLFGFMAVILLRAMNPDLWHPFFGGEKPMETAYFNAVARSETFPPFDPWFADGHINYYYYGFFLMAILTKLTGVPTDLAFQLSVATVGGLFAAGLFSLASTVSASMLHTRRHFWWIAGGIVAVFLTIFSGNLDAVRQILRQRSLEVDFWQSSRAVDFAITEFPYFSFLYGDLHPHLIAAPVLVLVLALAYSWIQNGQDATPAWLVLWGVVTALAIGSITVINFWDGPTVAVIVAAAMVLPLLRRPLPSLRRALLILAGIVTIGALAWISFRPFHSGFHVPTGGIEITSFGTSAGDWLTHFGAFVVVFLVLASTALIRIVRSGHYRYGSLVLGSSLAVTGFMLGAILEPANVDSFPAFILAGLLVASAGGLLAQIPLIARYRRAGHLALFAISPFLVLGGALTMARPVAAMSCLLVAGFLAMALASSGRDGVLLITITGAAGIGLVLTAELVYVADHLHGSEWERMNTVFKLYFQAWTLLSITAAITIVWFAQKVSQLRTHDGPWSGRPESFSRLATPAGTAVAVVFGLALLAYPVLASPDRLQHRLDSSPTGLSLAGYEWMNGGEIRNQAGDIIDFTGDYYAIEWLRDEVDANAVILEASIGPYRGGGSRISSATGLPTVLGWDSHQSQQRGSHYVRPRFFDVRELFQTADIDRKRYLLRQYNVRYVVVGDVERYSILGDIPAGGNPDYYSSPEGIAAFGEMVGEYLEIAFQAERTVVYEVLPFRTAGEES